MIRLQLEEYENLIKEITALHESSIELIEWYTEEMKGLLIPQGGFYAELVSEKAEMLLRILHTQLFPKIGENFEETEEQIYLLGERLTACDEERSGELKWKE